LFVPLAALPTVIVVLAWELATVAAFARPPIGQCGTTEPPRSPPAIVRPERPRISMSSCHLLHASSLPPGSSAPPRGRVP
jgi:hypothetical protein